MPHRSNLEKKRAWNELEHVDMLQKSGDKFVKKYTIVKAMSKAYKSYIR